MQLADMVDCQVKAKAIGENAWWTTCKVPMHECVVKRSWSGIAPVNGLVRPKGPTGHLHSAWGVLELTLQQLTLSSRRPSEVTSRLGGGTGKHRPKNDRTPNFPSPIKQDTIRPRYRGFNDR